MNMVGGHQGLLWRANAILATGGCGSINRCSVGAISDCCRWCGRMHRGCRQLRRARQGLRLLVERQAARGSPTAPRRQRTPGREKVDQQRSQRHDNLHKDRSIKDQQRYPPELTMVLSQYPGQGEIQMQLGHCNNTVEHGQIHALCSLDATDSLNCEHNYRLDTGSNRDADRWHNQEHNNAEVFCSRRIQEQGMCCKHRNSGTC
mmetsp:Transcript_72598/g.235883  ORF Transcript_72598/g.235883 Transcript_72598/m.235883 type:complete len:204 (-) Transcript_72598:7567-8178(-)